MFRQYVLINYHHQTIYAVLFSSVVIVHQFTFKLKKNRISDTYTYIYRSGRDVNMLIFLCKSILYSLLLMLIQLLNNEMSHKCMINITIHVNWLNVFYDIQPQQQFCWDNTKNTPQQTNRIANDIKMFGNVSNLVERQSIFIVIK